MAFYRYIADKTDPQHLLELIGYFFDEERQTKLEASVVGPLPLYVAVCG